MICSVQGQVGSTGAQHVRTRARSGGHGSDGNDGPGKTLLNDGEGDRPAAARPVARASDSRIGSLLATGMT